MKKLLLFTLFSIAFAGVFAQKTSNKDYLVTLETQFGTMHLVLFDDTPLHKANFVKLAKSGFYNDLLFHRIIADFMIQGGDPLSRNAKADTPLGSGGDDMERIPFEFTPKHVHKKGALAAARDNNPEKKSSACQFYIVDGKTFEDEQLTAFEKRNKITYTAAQRRDYMIIGGTPHLDNNYTVFGEVIDNFEVIDTIATQPKQPNDRPKEAIKMKISVKKISKKKIAKKYSYTFSQEGNI